MEWNRAQTFHARFHPIPILLALLLFLPLAPFPFPFLIPFHSACLHLITPFQFHSMCCLVLGSSWEILSMAEVLEFLVDSHQPLTREGVMELERSQQSMFLLTQHLKVQVVSDSLVCAHECQGFATLTTRQPPSKACL